MHKSQDKFKVKKKIRINSLQAAICNVALFKSMKDKDFKDVIFISYCEEGVILQATSQQQWKKAHQYIQSFLHNKKIQLLIDSFDKEVYENLINKGLKQITRRIREADQECPYINIIHYQKLRKSCQYMDKQKYVQPLKDWERKNKKNPNFAFLIVEPRQKFQQIKRNLLQYILNQPVTMKQITIPPVYFMYLLFYSPMKQQIRNNYNRRQIEIFVQKDAKQSQSSNDQVIKAYNYTNLNLFQFGYSIVKAQSNITKLGVGLEVISSSQFKQEVKNAKLYCKQNPSELIDSQILKLEADYGQNFLFVPYKQEQQQKFKTIIQKYSNTKFSKQEIQKKIQSHRIFEFQEIEFIDEIMETKKYKVWKAYINGCPFMIHQYQAAAIQMDTFVIYLQQLQLFYCAYLIRYYGLSVKRQRNREGLDSNQVGSYLLIFDYHHKSLQDMLQNDMILDNMQIATIVLQILYLINFLHVNEQPRCLGPITAKQIFWPMATVLPYLGAIDDEPLYSIENDVKQVGLLMKELLVQEQAEDLTLILQQMTNPNKYQRASVKKCINYIQQLLCI